MAIAYNNKIDLTVCDSHCIKLFTNLLDMWHIHGNKMRIKKSHLIVNVFSDFGKYIHLTCKSRKIFTQELLGINFLYIFAQKW